MDIEKIVEVCEKYEKFPDCKPAALFTPRWDWMTIISSLSGGVYNSRPLGSIPSFGEPGLRDIAFGLYNRARVHYNFGISNGGISVVDTREGRGIALSEDFKDYCTKIGISVKSHESEQPEQGYLFTIEDVA